MAFVTRSERKFNFSTNNSTNIGPGEYESEEIKQKAKLLHDISNKFSHISKNNNLKIIVPFNSTGERINFIKTDDTPGPGTYTTDYSFEKNSNENDIHSNENEIIFIEENGNLIPKLNKEIKGFLSSEKRFNDSNSNNENIGPGSYDLIKTFNKPNNHNNRYGKIELGRAFKSSRNSEICIPTIPDRNRGDFKLENGQIKEIKKAKDYELGPGQYNFLSKWANNALDWRIGLKKENKSQIYKDEIINCLNKNSSIEPKINNISNSKINKFLTKNISLNNLPEENQNNIRNIIFNKFQKYRQNLHLNSLNKLKAYNDIILDVKYNDTPGPGSYDSKKGQINSFKINKSQNFGSNSPKFFKIHTEDRLIGPGSYFLEKNKYEPKFESLIHIKKCDKKNVENNKDIGAFMSNVRNNNIERQPGPGQYDLEKDFIKKETSNVQSFGTLSERFKRAKSLNIKGDKEQNKENKKYRFNYKFDDKLKYKIDSKYLELKRKEEEKEKKRREMYMMSTEKPSVGTYSPEKMNTISYNVLSRVNPYRNKVAPFNVMNTRFENLPKSFKNYKVNLPGPGKYEVVNAYNALNNSKKTYNVFGVDSQRKENYADKIGPGLYEQNSPNSWNKKSFNILFMEKTDS